MILFFSRVKQFITDAYLHKCKSGLSIETPEETTRSKKTRLGIILSSLLHEPFASLYPILPIILIKNLGATSFQIVLFVMLKPIASIFSFYWSEQVAQKKHSLRRNLIGSGLLARIPFLFALFFDSVPLMIFASTLYMLYLRAGIPAWMEILKVNMPDKMRSRYFSIGSMLGYAEGVLLAITIGSFLDRVTTSWKWLYLAAILLGIIGVLVQASVPIQENKEPGSPKKERMGLWKFFSEPWKHCLLLMKKRPDFRRFQWAFMIGGFALMVIQPVIPIFFAETLNLSYRDLMIAYTICKGFGFVLTSPLWNYLMNRISVRIFTALVLLGFALFPLLIIFSLYDLFWLYLAYIVYGIAQAGSHLIWHLSGPIFAKEEESARFSGIGIMMVGVRGAIGPPLGGALAAFFGPVVVLSLSIVLGLTAIIPMLAKAPKRLCEPS